MTKRQLHTLFTRRRSPRTKAHRGLKHDTSVRGDGSIEGSTVWSDSPEDESWKPTAEQVTILPRQTWQHGVAKSTAYISVQHHKQNSCCTRTTTSERLIRNLFYDLRVSGNQRTCTGLRRLDPCSSSNWLSVPNRMASNRASPSFACIYATVS